MIEEKLLKGLTDSEKLSLRMRELAEAEAKQSTGVQPMNVFETIIRDLIIAGKIAGPIFIHSAQGIAILNASEEGASAIIGAHELKQATK